MGRPAIRQSVARIFRRRLKSPPRHQRLCTWHDPRSARPAELQEQLITFTLRRLKPGTEPMRKLALFLALLTLVPSTPAQSPLWSIAVGQAQLDPTPRPIDALTVLPDGSTVYFDMRATPTAGVMLQMAADGSLAQRPLLHRYPGPFDPDSSVLAANNDMLLLSAPAQLLMVDRAGKVLWASRQRVSAHWIDDADLLLSTDRELIRVRGADGTRVWTRHLGELHPYSMYGGGFDFARVGPPVDGRVEVALTPVSPSYARSGFVSGLISIDLADGSPSWVMSLPKDRPGASDCPMVASRSRVSTVWRDGNGLDADLVIETRQRSDGQLLWTRALPAVDGAGRPYAFCELSASDHLLVVARHRAEDALELVALNQRDGSIAWQRSIDRAHRADIHFTEDGDLVLATRWWSDRADRILRLSQSDGSIHWEIAQEPSLTRLRIKDGHLIIARATAVPSARREIRDVADGSLLSEREAPITRVLAPAWSATLAGELSCHAHLADNREVRTACHRTDTGMEVWSDIHVPVSGRDEVRNVHLFAIEPRRIGMNLILSREIDGQVVATSRVRVLDRNNGSLAWQLPERHPSQAARSAPDDGAYFDHWDCLVPSSCTGLEAHSTSRHSGIDGALLWSQPYWGWTVGTGLESILLRQSEGGANPDRHIWRLLDARSGATRWTLPPITANVGAFDGMFTRRGSPVVHQVHRSGAPDRTEIIGLDPGSGHQRWSIRATHPGGSISGVRLNALAEDDVLLLGTNARMEGSVFLQTPWLARVRASDGSMAWSRSVPAGQDVRTTMNLVRGWTPEASWADQTHQPPQPGGTPPLQRRTLAQIDLDTGELGVEHHYAFELAGPLNTLNTMSPVWRGPDGTLVFARYDQRSDGLAMPVLEGWASPSGPAGDLSLSIDDTLPILGHGASTVVHARLQNASTATVAGVRHGFVRTDDLEAQWLGCIPSAACSADAGRRVITVKLAPGQEVHSRWTVHADQTFSPVREIPDPYALGRGLFYLQPPFSFGDTNRHNQMVEVSTWLGGTSNGFE